MYPTASYRNDEVTNQLNFNYKSKHLRFVSEVQHMPENGKRNVFEFITIRKIPFPSVLLLKFFFSERI